MAKKSPPYPSVEERAYRIWEEEGRPHGHDLAHWLRAEAEHARQKPPARKAAPKGGSEKTALKKAGAKGGGDGKKTAKPRPQARRPRARA